MFRKRKILIVSGLPRSGTSLMMKILDHAGEPLIYDGQRIRDINNPNGYYEYESVKTLVNSSRKDRKALVKSWMNRGWIKLTGNYLMLIQKPFLTEVHVIFMTRSLDEIMLSQTKMSGLEPKDGEKELLELLRQESLKYAEQIADKFITIDYYELINSLDSVKEKLTITFGIDASNIDKVVDNNLYRNRT